MRPINRVAYILWPLGVLCLAAGWGYLKYGTLTLHYDWFDVARYHAIATEGYQSTSDAAYFPAFPLLWRLLGGNLALITFLNACIWLLAVIWLDAKCGIQRRALVLASVVPAVLFFAVPYSESLFFVTVTITATGVVKRHKGLVLIGVLLSVLTRPAGFILVPALFAARRFSGESWKTALTLLGIEAAAALGGFALVLGYQGADTGQYLGFFEAQSVIDRFRWPKFPFGGKGGDVPTLMDATALFVGVFAGRTLWHTRRGGQTTLLPVERLGLAGLFLTATIIVFFGGGQISGMNRFIFATAFFPLALSAWSKIVFPKWELPLLFPVWVLFSLMFNSLTSWSVFGYYLGAGVLVLVTLNALRSRKLRWLSVAVLLVLSAAAVVFFYQAGRWMG
jgi:hypothetical protein